MTVQSPLQGGPGLAQVRRLVTEIPGPCSRELLARREATVARGVSHVLPVFISAAGGGVLIDVDGNSLIDFGSGIAVTSVGNSAPRVAAGIREQADRFTHTCFMVTPYEDYVAVAHAKGLRDRRVMTRYAGRNAILPPLNGFAAQFATAVGGVVVVEFVFSYPGAGLTLQNAVLGADYPLAQGLLLVLSLCVIAANFIMDLLNFVLDPRVRLH